MMEHLSVKELESYLDDDLLKLLKKEDIRHIFLINTKSSQTLKNSLARSFHTVSNIS